MAMATDPISCPANSFIDGRAEAASASQIRYRRHPALMRMKLRKIVTRQF
jgi:hypothetical protein